LSHFTINLMNAI